MHHSFVKKTIFLLLVCVATITTVIAQDKKDSPVTIVMHLDIMPKYTPDALPMLDSYQRSTLNEKGIKRFNLLQEAGRPNHFTIIEEWAGQAAYDNHVGEAGSRQFRDKIQPLLGAPVDERLHTELK